MNLDLKQDDSWDACPAGELQRVADGLKMRRRWQQMNWAANAVGCVLLVAFVAGLMFQNNTTPQPVAPAPAQVQRVSLCKKVQGLLPAYVAGDLCPRDDDTVRRHLAACAHCRNCAEKLQAPAHTSDCPHCRSWIAFVAK